MDIIIFATLNTYRTNKLNYSQTFFMTMRQYKNLLLLALIFSGLVSCQSDEDGTEKGLGFNLDDTGLLLDGGNISSVGFYCLELNKIHGGEHWQDYYAKTKTVKDYNEIQFDIEIYSGSRYYPADTAVRNAIARLEEKYCKEKSSFIVDEMEKYARSSIPGKGAGWTEFMTAYINGEVMITCDKVLFGEEPGTNLCGHFRVLSDTQCLPVGINSPVLLYNYGEEMPTVMSEYLPTGAWIQYRYGLQFDSQPSERYDSITLHLTLPLLMEHVRDYAVELYRGNNPGKIFTEDVFNADCTICFNWE